MEKKKKRVRPNSYFPLLFASPHHGHNNHNKTQQMVLAQVAAQNKGTGESLASLRAASTALSDCRVANAAALVAAHMQPVDDRAAALDAHLRRRYKAREAQPGGFTADRSLPLRSHEALAGVYGPSSSFAVAVAEGREGRARQTAVRLALQAAKVEAFRRAVPFEASRRRLVRFATAAAEEAVLAAEFLARRKAGGGGGGGGGGAGGGGGGAGRDGRGRGAVAAVPAAAAKFSLSPNRRDNAGRNTVAGLGRGARGAAAAAAAAAAAEKEEEEAAAEVRAAEAFADGSFALLALRDGAARVIARGLRRRVGGARWRSGMRRADGALRRGWWRALRKGGKEGALRHARGEVKVLEELMALEEEERAESRVRQREALKSTLLKISVERGFKAALRSAATRDEARQSPALSSPTTLAAASAFVAAAATATVARAPAGDPAATAAPAGEEEVEEEAAMVTVAEDAGTSEDDGPAETRGNLRGALKSLAQRHDDDEKEEEEEEEEEEDNQEADDKGSKGAERSLDDWELSEREKIRFLAVDFPELFGQFRIKPRHKAKETTTIQPPQQPVPAASAMKSTGTAKPAAAAPVVAAPAAVAVPAFVVVPEVRAARPASAGSSRPVLPLPLRRPASASGAQGRALDAASAATTATTAAAAIAEAAGFDKPSVCSSGASIITAYRESIQAVGDAIQREAAGKGRAGAAPSSSAAMDRPSASLEPSLSASVITARRYAPWEPPAEGATPQGAAAATLAFGLETEARAAKEPPSAAAATGGSHPPQGLEGGGSVASGASSEVWLPSVHAEPPVPAPPQGLDGDGDTSNGGNSGNGGDDPDRDGKAFPSRSFEARSTAAQAGTPLVAAGDASLRSPSLKAARAFKGVGSASATPGVSTAHGATSGAAAARLGPLHAHGLKSPSELGDIHCGLRQRPSSAPANRGAHFVFLASATGRRAAVVSAAYPGPGAASTGAPGRRTSGRGVPHILKTVARPLVGHQAGHGAPRSSAGGTAEVASQRPRIASHGGETGGGGAGGSSGAAAAAAAAGGWSLPLRPASARGSSGTRRREAAAATALQATARGGGGVLGGPVLHVERHRGGGGPRAGK